jgi:CRISPR-associated endonuclease/helicase Cas3
MLFVLRGEDSMWSLYSHPGKLLKDHLYNVYRLGLKKFIDKDLNFSNLEEIKLLTKIALITHDFGKANKYFQRKLELKEQGKENDEEYKILTQKGINKSNHSLLSALFTYYIADEFIETQLYSLIAMVVVMRHHGNLKDFLDMISVSDWDLLEEQFNTVNLTELQCILNLSDINLQIKDLKFIELKNKLTGRDYRRIKMKLNKLLTGEENFLLINFIYSILISSDKADAIFYSKGLSYEQLEQMVFDRKIIKADSVDRYRQIMGWHLAENEMDKKRNEIYQDVINQIDKIHVKEDKILSINVPTGTGKTLTALSAGLKLRDKIGQSYRLIYALPFTTIIDQNYDEYVKVFTELGEIIDSSLLIKHHYLTPRSYIKRDSSGEELYADEDYDISKHLIESWNSEIIVTTFVQLIHSIFTNKNRELIKFNNIANSIILLDEVQSIPYKYWKLIRIIFKEMAEKLNCYFIFITATMPLIYHENDGEIIELASNKKEYYNFFDRIKLDLSHFKSEMNLHQFKEFISEELEKYPYNSILIVLNTIKTSIEIYDYIKEIVNPEEEETIYLSTNIIPREREKRIEQIGKSKKRQIVVSTQMVEAGVNIDLDRVYRDFAPLDSINQTCGRCNRNFDPNKKGVVILVRLVNENHHNKTFASYVYGDILRLKTEKLLSSLPETVHEGRFLEMNNKYFELINEVKGDEISNLLLEFIRELKYEKAFYHNDEGKIFQLIEQDYDTVNLFIELDKDAEVVWGQYQETSNIVINGPEDINKRRALFEQIKKDFLGYVITIPKKVASKQLDDNQLENNFNYVNIDQVEDVYKLETGFKRDNVELISFF